MDGTEGNSSDLRFRLPGSDRETQKRLFFDRRYGWVFDEWKDPADEAFAGGRGMFCVVPVAKVLLKMASQSANCAVESVLKAVECCGQISPLSLHATFTSQFQNFMDFTRARNINFPSVSGGRHIF